jgi:3-hydroxyisobutyrate dehydrogenase-like beta-hydroxyacid dehydrogenase
MKIGFIGLGIMGRPMALNLLRGGHPITVWARRAESMQPLLDAGASAAASPAALAAVVDLVISMVADAPDVEQVMLGEQGVASAGRAGQVAVDMSTIRPAAARDIAARLLDKGIDFLDARFRVARWARLPGRCRSWSAAARPLSQPRTRLLRVWARTLCTSAIRVPGR